jgi:hypothetical protein
MCADVNRIPDEPIVLVTINTLNDFQSQLRAAHQQITTLMSGVDGEYYRIDNYQSLNVTTSTLVSAMFEESQQKPGSATDPNVYHIVVGAARVLRIGALTLPQTFTPDKRTPVFSTVAEAISFARATIQKPKTSTSVPHAKETLAPLSTDAQPVVNNRIGS